MEHMTQETRVFLFCSKVFAQRFRGNTRTRYIWLRHYARWREDIK